MVLWSCKAHPTAGKNHFNKNDQVLKKLVQNKMLSQIEFDELLLILILGECDG